MTSDAAEERWRPQSETEREQVLQQLGKLLASPSFASSQRYPNLLRFVVEQTLAGQEDTLKERLLGIEVFRRAPDYDTNQDPVVRLSAAEVRKRLALYYQHPDHHHELVIALNPGSYVPLFRPAGADSTQPQPAVPDSTSGTQSRKTAFWRSWWLYGAASLLVCVAALSLGAYFFTRQSVTEQFWSPFLTAPGRVTLCVGTPDTMGPASNALPPPTVNDEILRSGRLGISNVTTLIHLGGALDNFHKAFQLELASQAGYPELHQGPVILIGALDNSWTMRLTDQLRYGFAKNEESMYIVDHRNPSARNWAVSLTQPPSSQSGDFAIIARYHDNTLGQPVVLVAGLSSKGTEAAGDVLSDPDFLKALFKGAPRDWDTVNFEAVVRTQVVEGYPGTSRLIAVEYW